MLFKDKASPLDSEYFCEISKVFSSRGINLDSVLVLSTDDDLGFKRNLEEYKNTFDNLIVINSQSLSFDIKGVLADLFDSQLIENENAREFLQAVINQTGVNYSSDFANLPLNSTLIPNINGAFQGFLIDEEDFTLSVVADTKEEFSVMCGKYVLPYLEKKFNNEVKRQIFKYVGDKNKLKRVIEKSKDVSNRPFLAQVEEKNGDCKITLSFNGEAIKESSNVIRYIVAELGEDIYAEFDTTLSQRLFDLLKLKNVKISTAESFTGGRIISALIKNSGVSSYLHEGIVCYSNKSKMERLGVKKDDLIRSGAVSSIVAYQMTAGLLRDENCDVAISTTGIAGPKSDDTLKPVGLCYIGVGMRDGVHTYKFNLKGDRESITEQAKNIALSLAIKKLKKI